MQTFKRLSLITLAALCLLPAIPTQARPFTPHGFLRPTRINIVAYIKNGQSGTGSGKAAISFLLTDSATGQTGQAGQSSNLTLTVTLPGATTPIAATGTLVDTSYGDYDYYPAASETAANGILKLHVVGAGFTTGDYSAQVLTDLPGGSVASVTAPVTLASTQAYNNTGQTTKSPVTLASTDISGTLTVNTGNFPATVSLSSGDETKIGLVGTNAMDSPNAQAAQSATTANGTNLGTLLARLTAQRAVNLDYLDALISSRVASSALPTNFGLLSINGSGAITTSNPTSGGSTVTEASIWGYGARTLTAQADSPGTTTLLARPAQTGDTFGLVNPLVASGRFTTNALSNAPTGSGGGSGLTAQQVANAVWDEPKSAHTTASTFGAYLDRQVSLGMLGSSYVAQTGDSYALLNGLETSAGSGVLKASALANAPTGSGGGGSDPLTNPITAYTTPGTAGYYIANTLARRSDVPTDANIQADVQTALAAVIAQVNKIYGAEWGSIVKNSDGSYNVLAVGSTAVIGTVHPTYTAGVLQGNTKTVN